MMSKKAQDSSQIFIYIMTIVVLGMILIFGYRSITSIKERTEQVVYIKLKADLENSIKQLSSDYGSVSVKELEIPPKFQKLCFVSNELIDGGMTGITGGKYPIIDDSVQSKVRNNVFMVPDGSDAVYVGKIEASPSFFCADNVAGKVKVRLEGLGDRTKVSQFQGTIEQP